MQQIYLNFGFHGYTRLMKYISNIAHLGAKDQSVIKHRLKVIAHYEKFGKDSTKSAFGVSKSTIYAWKTLVTKAGGYLSGLKPQSKAPHTRSQRVRCAEIESFVIQYSIKRYIICALDIKTKFAFAYAYKTLSSDTAKDFLIKLESVAPFHIQAIQTDNGKEFMKHFRDYAQIKGLTHYYNYPKCPKMNTFVERFNRTIQEQHIGWHMNDLYEPKEFNLGLMQYLVWYNTEKPPTSLGKLPPLKYYLDNFVDINQSSMLWTSTFV